MIKDLSTFGQSTSSKHEKQDLFSDSLCDNPEPVSCSTTKQLQIDESEIDSKATTESNSQNMYAEEDSNLFKEHFGSLSNSHKVSPLEYHGAMCIRRLFWERPEG